MTDKFRRTHPLNITIADGEAPTAAKLTAIATQSRVGARLLEKAVGDLWNQSGDSILNDWPLQIPNLARSIGEAKYLNPFIYPVTEQFTYRDNLGTKFTGLNSCHLQFAPATLASVVAVVGSTNLTNKVASEHLVLVSGDYWVDLTTGRFRSFNALATTDKLDYTVDSSAWGLDDTTFPTVIPDVRQLTFTGCRISASGGTYYIHLPPRRPLELSGFERPERYPSSSDISSNEATAITPYKLWQSGAVVALGDVHYRYPLPKEINDIIASLDVGTTLPEGFIYLWNQDKRTVVEDATFRTSSLGDWILEVSSLTEDFTSKVTTDETVNSYNNSGYSLIVVGSPLSRSVASLSRALYGGQYSNSGDFTPVLDHSKLKNLNPPVSTYSEHGGRYPTTVPAWAPSRWAFDDHVSLLSRAGSQGGSSEHRRDVNDNAMLGDLVLASTVASGGNLLNTTSDSNRLYLGKRDSTTAPHLYALGGGTDAFFNNATLNIHNLQAEVDAIDLSISSSDDGFGGVDPPVDNNIWILVTVFDVLGREIRRAVETFDWLADTLGSGGDMLTITLGDIPDWVVTYRIYYSSNSDFSTAKQFWENNDNVQYGGFPGSDAFSNDGDPLIAGDDFVSVHSFNKDTTEPSLISTDLHLPMTQLFLWCTDALGGINFQRFDVTDGSNDFVIKRGLDDILYFNSDGNTRYTFDGTGVLTFTPAATAKAIIADGTVASGGLLDLSNNGNGHTILTEAQGAGNAIQAGGYGSGTTMVVFNNGTGRGATFQADVSSPVAAAIRIVPQDTQPSGPNVIGDIYVTTAGVLKICTGAGTPGTWVSVGAQT